LKNLLPVGTFKNAKFEAKNLKNYIFGKFRGEVEILSTHNLCGWKFATVCCSFVRNLQSFLENCNFWLHLLF